MAGCISVIKKKASVQERAGSQKKRPACVMKKPAVQKKPSKSYIDKRQYSRWLWLAVTVGTGKKVHTHSNGMKIIAFEILPHKTVALEGKPRGIGSIKGVLKRRIRKRHVPCGG